MAEEEFLCKQKSNRTHMVIELKRAHDMNDLHNELGHPLEDITEAAGKAMDLKVRDTF